MKSRSSSSRSFPNPIYPFPLTVIVYVLTHINPTLGVFVCPPLDQLPRSPKDFFRFMYPWSKQKATDLMGLFMFKFATGWKFWKDTAFKRNKAQIVPAAKALHASMSEALARGDKTALRRVCTSQLLSQLTVAIERRPRGKRYGWELVQYNNTRFYPRVVDDKIAMFPDGMGTVRQAVVAIASRQRRVEYDDSLQGGGRVIPGSEKEADLMEYLVLTACVDAETNKQKDWVVFGTIKPTTLQSFENEKALMKAAEEAELSKYKT